MILFFWPHVLVAFDLITTWLPLSLIITILIYLKTIGPRLSQSPVDIIQQH